MKPETQDQFVTDANAKLAPSIVAAFPYSGSRAEKRKEAMLA